MKITKKITKKNFIKSVGIAFLGLTLLGGLSSCAKFGLNKCSTEKNGCKGKGKSSCSSTKQ